MSRGSTDGIGTAARFDGPGSVALDSANNLYVADTQNNTIRKISPAGVVSTLAGTPGIAGSADGTGSAARFSHPSGVAVDSAGNVYVADEFNNAIREITPAGVVTTLASAAASFSQPSGVAVDSAGNVYVADTNNCTIRKVTPGGLVTTLAGMVTTPGSADGTGSEARFESPAGVAVDSAGNVYVGDRLDFAIRKVTPDGIVTTLAGSRMSIGTSDGTGSAAGFVQPTGVAVDSTGNVYVADSFSIRKVTAAGVVTTLVGSASGSAAGVAVDGAGNVYVADAGYSIIREITSAGTVTTLAGVEGGSTDGAGAAARFSFPAGIAVDSVGNIYVADSGNETIRKVTSMGVVTTLAGSPGRADGVDGTGSAASFGDPSGVAVDSLGNVYVADQFDGAQGGAIRKVTAAGVVTTRAARLFGMPRNVAVDSDGNIYVTDFFGSSIQMINPAGALATLAGSTNMAGSADGTGSAASFNRVSGMVVDGAGNLYAADTGNSTIRKITATGVVTTLAGTPGMSGSADGTGAAARFLSPSSVTTDSSGNVYVIDGPASIRRITPAGVTTTIALDPALPGYLTSLAIVGNSIIVNDDNAIILLPSAAQ